MSVPLEQYCKVLINEIFRCRYLVIGLFVVINVSVITVGLFWPKTYTSSTTILVEEKNIIQPLMRGAAVVTDVRDRGRRAKNVIFSRKIMSEIIDYAGWAKNNPSDIERERLAEALKSRTAVNTAGQNLIKIEYRDTDPERAYKTVGKYAELFINESLGNQSDESKAAFEFIVSQVEEYHVKLLSAEQQLKEFRSMNVDARPGTGSEIAGKINALQATIEKTSLDSKEAQIKLASIEKQLSGEVVVTASLTREGQYAARIVQLQGKMDNLRLNYHDTYPDIVSIKHQIENLKEAINNEKKQRETAKQRVESNDQTLVDEGIRLNPLYQQLRKQLFETKIKIETLSTRLSETKKRLGIELNRARRVHGGEATLAELTRDYEVNRDIYQDLLRRRENARVSKNLDRDKQGLTLRIHEPAFVPLRPSGVRFMHFIFGGILLGLAVPTGLIFGFQQVDPRIRFKSLISEKLNVPVLATVPHLVSPAEGRAVVRSFRFITVMLLFNLGFVITTAFIKYFEIL